jgi:prenyl protein peptidase
MVVIALLRSSSLRWAAGGWAFFIAENLILSENRTFLIDQVGDTSYHNIYGACSTAAVGSIVYAYLYKIRGVEPFLSVTPASRAISFVFFSLGLGFASQTAPKLQIPVAYVPAASEAGTSTNVNVELEHPRGTSTIQVRCPFDFTDKKASSDSSIQGIERVTRHPGLWSMALVGLGQSFLTPSLPQRIWLIMPTFVAAIGGWHTDSRYRRGMGGTLDAKHDAATSNVPFWALARNGSWKELGNEMKPLNAALATSIAAIWVLRRGSGTNIATLRKAAVAASR